MLATQVIVALVAPSVHAAEGVQIVVSTAPGGTAAGTVALPIRTRDAAGTVTLFLREADGEAATGVVLYAAPPAGMSVGLARPGPQAPAAALSVDLPAGASLDVAVTATWDDYGTADVPLLARVGAEVSAVGSLRVERPGGPPLTVVGATATGLALASSGPALESGITVATGNRPAVMVMASVSPLLDTATGTRYPVAEEAVELGDLAANATALVPIDAALPYTGTFTATLRLTHDGITDPPVALTITRTLATSGVTVDAVQSSSSSFEGYASTQSVIRAVVLNEVAGKQASLNTPVLVKPSAKVGDAASTDPNAKVVDTVVSPARPGCGVKGDVIAVAAGQSCRVEVTLQLPGDPGQYDGTLRFPQPGASPLDAPMSVQLRRGVWTAVAVIALGLGVGYLLNVVLRNRRTRLERLASVARIARALDERVAGIPGGLRDDTERRVYAGLRTQLASVVADADGGAVAAATINERLEVIGLQVPVFAPWVTLRRAVLAAPDAVRAALTPDVEDFERALAAPITPDQAKALDGDIKKLETKLREHHSTAVRNEIERTKNEVNAMFADDDVARRPIAEQLESAKSFVASGEGSPDEALGELERARGMAVDAMKTRLGVLLKTTAPPFGINPTEWSVLRGAVQHDVDGADSTAPDIALLTLRDADRRLIGGIVEAAHTKLSQDLQAIPIPHAAPDAKQADALTAILAHLDDARQALSRGDLANAHVAYDEARAAFTAPPTGVRFLGPAGVPLSAPELPTTLQEATTVTMAVPTVTAPPLPTLAAVQRSWQWYEVILACAVVVVGVAVGLIALYVGKPTWGSLGDLLLAVLWGAGLYQVTGALHAGFPGVRTALVG